MGRKKKLFLSVGGYWWRMENINKSNAPITSFWIPSLLLDHSSSSCSLLCFTSHSEQCLLQSRLDQVPGAPSPLLQRSHDTGGRAVQRARPLTSGFPLPQSHACSNNVSSPAELSLSLSLLVICKQVHLYGQHAHVHMRVYFDSDFWNGRRAATDAGSWQTSVRWGETSAFHERTPTFNIL